MLVGIRTAFSSTPVYFASSTLPPRSVACFRACLTFSPRPLTETQNSLNAACGCFLACACRDINPTSVCEMSHESQQRDHQPSTTPGGISRQLGAGLNGTRKGNHHAAHTSRVMMDEEKNSRIRRAPEFCYLRGVACVVHAERILGCLLFWVAY